MSDYQIGELLAKYDTLVKQGHVRFTNEAEHPELSEGLLDLIGVTADQWEKLRVGQREREKLAVQKGDMAPNFELPYLTDPEQTFRLSYRQGQRPVALIFAAYT